MAVHFANLESRQSPTYLNPSHSIRVHGRLDGEDELRVADTANGIGGAAILALGVAFLVGVTHSIAAALITGLSIYFIIKILQSMGDGSSRRSRYPQTVWMGSGRGGQVPPPVVYTPSGTPNPHATFGSRSTSAPVYAPPQPQPWSFPWVFTPSPPPSTHGTFGSRSTGGEHTPTTHVPPRDDPRGTHGTFGSRRT